MNMVGQKDHNIGEVLLKWSYFSILNISNKRRWTPFVGNILLNYFKQITYIKIYRERDSGKPYSLCERTIYV